MLDLSAQPQHQESAPNLSQLKELSGCLFDIYHVDRQQDRNRFIDAIFRCYSKLIPFDAAMWSGTRYNIESLSDPIIHYMHFNNLPSETASYWELAENYEARGKMIAHMIANVGKPMIVNSETLGLEKVFQQLFGSRGICHLLSIYLLDPATKLHSVISLYRLRDLAYTQAERWLHELAAPHIQAVLRSQALTLLGSSSDNKELTGSTAITDREGTLHHAHPQYIQLLKEEWTDWQPPQLPIAGALSKPLLAGQAIFTGERIVILAQPKGELFLLYARLKDRFDNLTRRERQVASLFAKGQSYKEVARVLDISPATVRTMLANIYKKAGVSDKGELTNGLAARLPWGETAQTQIFVG